MSAFHFPQPGELQNASAIPVPGYVLSRLLLLAAEGFAANHCERVDCDPCVRLRRDLEHTLSQFSEEDQHAIITSGYDQGVTFPARVSE